MPGFEAPLAHNMAVMMLLLALGACWGSFAATVSQRWPAGRSIVRPRSHCEDCGTELRAFDLIPLVSFAFTRGHCRTCQARIPARYPIIEFACAIVGLFASFLFPWPLAGWIAVLGWQLILLAILDAEHFWLPDVLVGGVVLTGVLAALWAGADALVHGLVSGMLGFATLQLIAWAYKRLRGRPGMGGGDPKLLGAIGIWTGWQVLPVILLAAALLGVVAAFSGRAHGEAGAPLLLRRVPLGSCLAASAWLYCLIAWLFPGLLHAPLILSYN